ncbi:MAG TPA: MFS transporter [Streptosporangiaceae bacterium]|nr:MFS transporter [Streptosporangiaceae bacterium]
MAFFASGFAFASWAARIPQVRARLDVTPGVLGLILLCIAIGSAVSIPLAGWVIVRIGEARTVAVTAIIAAAGLAVVAVGYTHGIPPVAAGLFCFGFGSGAWDVAMNVQGAAVEQAVGRSVLPRMHAAWSIGTVAGAGAGTVLVASGIPVTADLLTVAVAVAIAVPVATRNFLRTAAKQPQPGRREGSVLEAWTERRTLLIGLFVLCVSVIEGVGNDWLSLGVIQGYHAPAAVGTAAFALFLAAMTAGRWFGPRLIDRYGRVRVLRPAAAVALAGLLMLGLVGVLPVAFLGAAAMGLGTALGFPVGLSAAADDPARAAGRVSAASSLGYGAFLAGPPLIGFIADHAGVLHALACAGVLLVAALFLSQATAPVTPGPARILTGPDPDWPGS